MPVYDRNSREKDLALKQQLEAMTPEDRRSLKLQVQAELNRRGQGVGGVMNTVGQAFNSIKPKLGQVVGGMANQFAQQGGLKPQQPQESELNKILMREQVKSMFKEPKEEKPKPLKDQAMEAVQNGETLPGLSMEETKKAAGVYIPPKTAKPLKRPVMKKQGYEETNVASITPMGVSPTENPEQAYDVPVKPYLTEQPALSNMKDMQEMIKKLRLAGASSDEILEAIKYEMDKF